MSRPFTEKSLEKAIHEKWGEHGAHAEIYQRLLNRQSAADKLAEILERIRKTDHWQGCLTEMRDYKCECPVGWSIKALKEYRGEK